MTQTIDVSAVEPQVETQVTRISEVLPEEEVRSLPLQGRGVLNLSLLTPGVTGKPTPPENYCFSFRIWRASSASLLKSIERAPPPHSQPLSPSRGT
ncbi:MAG: hypothetical protein L0338_07455 [Acidobacteria bacterium]|nr:hypothetical protein [Acidobacteriota bacterium]